MSDVVVDLRHVRREYQTGDVPTVALADVSLTVERGEFVAIVGPSGSGKTSMIMKIIHKLLQENLPKLNLFGTLGSEIRK